MPKPRKTAEISQILAIEDMTVQAGEKLLRQRGTKREPASAAKIAGAPMTLASLTHRQDVFCEAVAMGRTGIDSYRLAFDCPTSSAKTISRKVSSLLARPDIRQQIEQHKQAHRQAHERAMIRTAKDVTRALWAEAESQENGGSVRVRALELLGKDLGMFSDNKGLADASHKSPTQIEQEIKTLLGRFMGEDAKVINGLAKKD